MQGVDSGESPGGCDSQEMGPVTQPDFKAWEGFLTEVTATGRLRGPVQICQVAGSLGKGISGRGSCLGQGLLMSESMWPSGRVDLFGVIKA